MQAKECKHYTSKDFPTRSFFNKFLQISLDERSMNSKELLEKYPERVPVLVDKHYRSTISDISKHRFLVPKETNISKFIYQLYQYIILDQNKSIYLFIDGDLPKPTESIGNLYNYHKNDDGFLYISYSGENVFGQK